MNTFTKQFVVRQWAMRGIIRSLAECVLTFNARTFGKNRRLSVQCRHFACTRTVDGLWAVAVTFEQRPLPFLRIGSSRIPAFAVCDFSNVMRRLAKASV